MQPTKPKCDIGFTVGRKSLRLDIAYEQHIVVVVVIIKVTSENANIEMKLDFITISKLVFLHVNGGRYKMYPNVDVPKRISFLVIALTLLFGVFFVCVCLSLCHVQPLHGQYFYRFGYELVCECVLCMHLQWDNFASSKNLNRCL